MSNSIRRLLTGSGAIFAAGILLGAAGIWVLAGSPMPWSGGEESGSVPFSTELADRGSAIYQANCARCHGERGEGQPNWKTRNPDGTVPPPPHDSTGHTWHHSDGLLFRIVRDGGKIYESPGFKSSMPAWGDVLSNEEIVAVITYLKTLWGPSEREVQAEVSEQDPFPLALPVD